jgi:hypothetical protein
LTIHSSETATDCYRNWDRTEIDRIDQIVWTKAEELLHNSVSADLLLIFDCCFAGSLAGGFRGGGLRERKFEFLGATGSNGLTRAPGKQSFTAALIWALREFSEAIRIGNEPGDRGGFTTSQLYNKILCAPDFPSYVQTPVLTERGNHSSKRLYLRPLPRSGEFESAQTKDLEAPAPAEARFNLDVRFVLSDLPSLHEVEVLATGLKNMVESGESKATSILWKGLHRAEESEEIPPAVYYAAKKWQAIARKRKVPELELESQAAPRVKWAPILGKRANPEVGAGDIEEHERLRPASKRARTSSRKSSLKSSLLSPPTTPSNSLEHLSEASLDFIGDNVFAMGSPVDLSSAAVLPHTYPSQDQAGQRLEGSTFEGSTTKLRAWESESAMQQPVRISAIRQFNENRAHRREQLRSCILYRISAFEQGIIEPSIISNLEDLAKSSEIDLQQVVTRVLKKSLAELNRGNESSQILRGMVRLALSYADSLKICPYASPHQGLSCLVVKPERLNVADFLPFDLNHVRELLIQIATLLEGFSENTRPRPAVDHTNSSTLTVIMELIKDFYRATDLISLWQASQQNSGTTSVAKVCTALQAVADLVDMIGLATSDGHIGELWDTMPESQRSQIQLPLSSGVTNIFGNEDVQLSFSSRHFKCLNEFTGGRPAWVLHSPSVLVGDQLYLSVTLADLAKVWGPAWTVHESPRRDSILEVRIRCGHLIPSVHNMDVDPRLYNHEYLAHWTSDALLPLDVSLDDSNPPRERDLPVQQSWEPDEPEAAASSPARIPLCFTQADRLLIGALSTYNPKLRRRPCQCPAISIKKNLHEKGVLHRLGTSRPCRYLDGQQVSIGWSQYINVGTQSMLRTDPGQPLKRLFLSIWQNEPRRRHPSELEDFCGLLVSACTFNGVKVRGVDLLKTPTMRRHLGFFPWKNTLAKLEFFEALSNREARALSTLWDGRPELQSEIGEALLYCITTLSQTGYDLKRNELNVLWISEGEHIERRVSMLAKEHNWIRFLKDTQDSMTMAVLIEDSLFTKRSHSRRCGRNSQPTVLETAFGINGSATGSSDLQVVIAGDTAESEPWREPDRVWEKVWSVRYVADGQLGKSFKMRGGSRLTAKKRLTETHLLLECSSAKRELLNPILGPRCDAESSCHWEQAEDLSRVDDTTRDAVRPLPVHIY